MKLDLVSDRVEVPDSLEAVNDWFQENGLSDGLPIVPPTEDRVGRMIEGSRRNAQEVIGNIPPNWAPATVEKIAINAVMAGCLPEYMPVIIAAVEATLEPEFNLYALQATTGQGGPTLIVSGSIAEKLDINGGAGCFGPGWRANATIGRAIRLILITLGGGRPAIMDKATFGWPGKYTFCFAENEGENPWEPLRVERGFRRDESTVTVAGVNALEGIWGVGLTSRDVLDSLVASLVGNRAGGHLIVGGFGGGTPVVILSPDVASVIAREVKSVREVQAYLYENVTVPLSEIPAHRIGNRTLEQIMEQCDNVTRDGKVHMCASPSDIVVVVCGGSGSHALLLPGWAGRNTRLVTKAIRT